MDTETQVLNIPIEDIIPNRFQPRLNFDEDGLNELAASIKQHGIIQPLVLRRLDDKYEIIAGERRYKAAKMAGLTTVPAIVRVMNDKDSAEVAIVENVQRRDLSAIEEAKSYKTLLDKGYLTQEELAKKMGLSQSAISNKLRLLSLDESVQNALMEGKISERHARTLLKLNDKQDQAKWLKTIIEERLTVQNLEKRIKGDIKKDDDIPRVESAPSIDSIRENAVDILSSPANQKVVDIVPQNTAPANNFDKPMPNKFFNFLEDEEVNMNVQEHPPVVESAPVEEEIELLDFDISSPEVNMIEPKKDMSKARNLVDNLVSELRSNEYDVTLDTEEADKLKFIIEISKD